MVSNLDTTSLRKQDFAICYFLIFIVKLGWVRFLSFVKKCILCMNLVNITSHDSFGAIYVILTKQVFVICFLTSKTDRYFVKKCLNTV